MTLLKEDYKRRLHLLFTRQKSYGELQFLYAEDHSVFVLTRSKRFKPKTKKTSERVDGSVVIATSGLDL